MRWGSVFMKSGKFILLTLMLIFSLPYLYGGCVVVFSSGDTNRDKNQIVDDSVDDSGSILAPAQGPSQVAHLTTGFPVPDPHHLHARDGNATDVSPPASVPALRHVDVMHPGHTWNSWDKIGNAALKMG